jgi:RNA polymerase sigma-70 factor (ECF subfamily)
MTTRSDEWHQHLNAAVSKVKRALKVRVPPELRDSVLQTTFEKACRKRAQYRGNGGGVLSWLLTIAKRVTLDKQKAFSRREKKHVPLPSASGASTGGRPILVTGGSPESVFGDREEQQRARCALEALPEQQRLVLRLHHLEGLSLKEVAQRLNVSYGRVAGECRRGDEALRRVLKGQPAIRPRETKS